MADICGVYLARRGELERAVWRGRADLPVNDLSAFPLHSDPQHPIRRAFETRRTILVETVETGDVDRAAVDERHRELLHSLRPKSAIITPLIVRRRALGVLLLLRVGSNEPYHESDVAYAEAIAELTALAIDYGRLMAEREAFIADVAHELKTPLTSILLAAQLAQRRPAHRMRYVEQIEGAARNLRDVTNTMLESFVEIRRALERKNAAARADEERAGADPVALA